MNLQEFTSPLPKPWLTIEAQSVDANVYTIEGQVMYGSYTPTITVGSNIGAVTASSAFYHRQGDVVFMSGRFTAAPTSTTATMSFDVAMPGTFLIATIPAGSASYCTSTASNVAILCTDVVSPTASSLRFSMGTINSSTGVTGASGTWLWSAAFRVTNV